MTRLACLRAIGLASALLTVTGAGTAWASTAVSVYVAASRVDTMPDDASATTVAIHGAFILLKSDGSWEAPQCGVMYFKCAPGSETMCRMQWQDLRTYGTMSGTCGGFGTQDKTTMATIRSEGAPLTSPDDWDLGMGVMLGSSIGNQCPLAKAMACAKPTGTGGAGGGGGNGGAGGATGTGGATGAAGAAGTAGAAGGTTEAPARREAPARPEAPARRKRWHDGRGRHDRKRGYDGRRGYDRQGRHERRDGHGWQERRGRRLHARACRLERDRSADHRLARGGDVAPPAAMTAIALSATDRTAERSWDRPVFAAALLHGTAAAALLAFAAGGGPLRRGRSRSRSGSR